VSNFVKPSIQEVFQMIDAAVKHAPEKTKGYEGVYQFNLKNENNEESIFQLIIDAQEPRTVEGIEKEAQVTLMMAEENFRKLIDNSLNPTAAFMSGKLKIKGNMGLALKLQTVLNSFDF